MDALKPSAEKMKNYPILFSSLLFLAVTGCGKPLIDGLSASMSDERILEVLKVDPTKRHSKETIGKDGTSTIYIDGVQEIRITRSIVSGVIVMRMEPAKDRKTWNLGTP